MDVNKGNIEEYLLLLLDGELDTTAAAEVMEFIESHVEYKLLMDEYLQARMEPEAIVFEDKEMLLKQEAIIMPLKKKRVFIAYAAAITAIIGISIVFKMLNHDKRTQGPSMALGKIGEPAIDTLLNQSLVIKESNEKEAHKHAGKPLSVEKKDTVQGNVVVAAIVPRPKMDVLNGLPVADFKRMDVMSDNKAIVSEAGIEDAGFTTQGNIALDEKDDTDPEKAAFFNNLLAQLETMKDNVREKAKSLHVSAFSIQLGNKEFTIGK